MRCRTKHCETILYSWNKRREASPRNTRHLTNAGSQLVQRRFRRASVKTSICPISPSSQYTLLMCARHVRLIDGAHNTTKLHIIILQKRSGNSKKSSPNVGLMLPIVYDAVPALIQHRINISCSLGILFSIGIKD